jgi:Secretion system C-terminal sorting domain
MKKSLLLVSLLFALCTANAQYYYLPYPNAGQNPGNLNNDPELTFGSGMAAGWKTVLGPSNATPAWSLADTIPFAFLFNGNPFSEYIVSSSGILSFDVFTSLAAPAYAKSTYPNATIPDYSVGIWGINGKGFNDYIVSKTFGTSPNRQHWIQFSSYGYGTVISDASNFAFWSIVLEETTNAIYIVDSRTAGYSGSNLVSIGVQVDANTAFAVAGSPNTYSLAGTNASALDNSYYKFIQGTQATYDLAVSSITTPLYLSLGNNSIRGTIKNFGVDTVSSFKMNYSINGAAPVDVVISGVSIPSFDSYTFIHSIPWNSTASGTYTISCFATDINGNNADQNTENDTLSKAVNILAGFEQRIPFFEIFTSSTCPPCKPGNLNFHSVVDTINQAKFVSIKYQQDYPGSGDPYTTTESKNRSGGYYGINSIPRMEIDGGWDENANSFTYAEYTQARQNPAAYKMNGSFTADTLTKTFAAKVRYAPLYNSIGAKLTIAIVEKTTTQNVKTNGETQFFNVMKKMLPDENGTLLAPSAEGVWDSITSIYTFNGNYRLPINGQSNNIINNSLENSVEQFSDLTLLAWIQANDVTKQVLQSANFSKDNQIGIYTLNKSISSITIYPNPVNDFARVDIRLAAEEKIKLKLIDENGRSIESKQVDGRIGMTSVDFDLSHLSSGHYYISLSDSKNNSFVRRLVLVH